jgi:hypothetical protein
MDFLLSFLVLNLIVFSSYTSEAANCFGGPVPGSTPAVEDYQRAADQICQYTPSIWLGIGSEGASPSLYYVAIVGNFTGSEKTECWVSEYDSIDLVASAPLL